MSETPVTRAEFEALRAELADIKALLKAQVAPAPEMDEETLQVIAAAVAAYLGKRASFRIVRRISEDSEAWRTQGRATVSARHELPRTRAW